MVQQRQPAGMRHQVEVVRLPGQGVGWGWGLEWGLGLGLGLGDAWSGGRRLSIAPRRRRSVRDCVAGEVWHQVRRQVVGDVVVLLLLVRRHVLGRVGGVRVALASRMWIGSLAAAL
jgi:hypothetical protein